MNQIQRLEAAGLASSSPNDPHYVRIMNRRNPTTDNRSAHEEQIMAYNSDARRMKKPPDKLRQMHTDASSVASSRSHWGNDPIHRMVNTMLTEYRDMLPEDSIVVKMKLSIPSPEEYSGSPDLEVFKTFIAGILRWLKLNGLLVEDNADFQVEYLGTRVVHYKCRKT